METGSECCVLRGKTSGAGVSLKSVSYEIKLVGICCEVQVVQHFRNDTAESIEAVYLLPKDEGAVITEFFFVTNGVEYRTNVAEKNEAFRLYDEAIQAGNGAAMMDEISLDLIQISVGNLKPGQEATFTLCWIQEMSVVDGKLRMLFPLTRFPRYLRAEADPVQADVQNATLSADVPYAMSLVVIWENSLIAHCTSLSHTNWEMVTQNTPNGYTAMQMSGSTPDFARDLVLLGDFVKETPHIAYTATHENGSQFLYARFTPQLESWAAASRKNVVFFLDCSGSMKGSPIANARKALELCLRSLSIGDTFSFILFGSEHRIVNDTNGRPFVYGDETLASALKILSATRATMGGTELYAAVKELLTADSGEQEWILLTDGGVSDPETVVNLVARSHHKPRIFTFGIGNGASTSLLKGLARVSGGSCEMISNDSDITQTVLRQFARIDQPRFLDMALEGCGKYDLAEPLSSLFEGDSANAIAFLEGREKVCGKVMLSAMVDGKKQAFSAIVKDLGKWNALGALWAAKKVRYLEATQDQGGSRQAARAAAVKSDEILRIALEYGILCSKTSLVGVEKRNQNGKWLNVPVLEMIPGLLAADRIDAVNEVEIDMCFTMPSVKECDCMPEKSISANEKVFACFGRVITHYEDDIDVPTFLRKNMSASSAGKGTQFDCTEILGAMGANGLFDYNGVIGILEKHFENINAMVKDLMAEGHDKPLIATMLALAALEQDTVSEDVSKKARAKAFRALEKAGIKKEKIRALGTLLKEKGQGALPR